jgi:hypothetical protein
VIKKKEASRERVREDVLVMVKVNPSLISAACGVKEPQTGAADEMAEVGVPGDEERATP